MPRFFRDFQGTPNPGHVATVPAPPEERGAWDDVPRYGVWHDRRCGLGLPVPSVDMVPSSVELSGDAVTGLLRASLAFPGGEVSGLGVDHADALHRLADVIAERVAAAAAITSGVCTCGAREGAV